jgi:hypothetical protein
MPWFYSLRVHLTHNHVSIIMLRFYILRIHLSFNHIPLVSMWVYYQQVTWATLWMLNLRFSPELRISIYIQHFIPRRYLFYLGIIKVWSGVALTMTVATVRCTIVRRWQIVEIALTHIWDFSFSAIIIFFSVTNICSFTFLR